MKLHVFFLALSLFAATCAALESPTCPPGYMTNGTTYGACDLRECIECPMGRFSSAANSLSCEECVPPAFSNTPGAIVCMECEHNKYAAGRAPGYVECRACPEGSKCARGEITTIAGYWGVLSLPEPPQVFHCPNEDACVGDNKCAKNREAAETNPLCGKCASGYAPTYSDSIRGYDGGCVSCSTPNVGAAVGGYLLGVAAVALLVLLEYKGKRLCAPFFALIFFCQILEVVLSADDDKDVQEDLAVAFNAFAFPHTLRFADACVVSDSMEGLVMADMFTQLFYLSQAAVVAAVLYFVKRDALGAAKNVAVYLVFITIVPSVRAAAAPFNCKDVAGARLVRVAPAIDCDDAAGLAALGAIIMCLYVLTPIVILLRVRLGKIEPHEQLLAPFWRRNYRASAWWFFAIMWATLMLIAWAPTITTSHTPIYLSAILSLALLSHSFWLPFKANADARTAFAGLLVPWLLTLMMLPGDSSSYNYSTVHSGFLLAISWLTVLVLLARTAVRMKLCCCGQVKESDGQVDDDYYNDVQGDEESGQ